MMIKKIIQLFVWGGMSYLYYQFIVWGVGYFSISDATQMFIVAILLYFIIILPLILILIKKIEEEI